MSVIALALFIFGYNFLKGKNLLENSRTFYAVYEQVEGLSASSAVTINGLQVGTVTNIEILPNTSLLVTMNINNDFPFSKSSIAEIYGGNLIGGKTIAIIPDLEDKRIAQPGDTLQSEIEAGLLELVNDQLAPLQQKLEEVVSSVDTITRSVNFIVDEKSRLELKESISSLSVSMQNLAKISDKADRLITENSSSLTSTVNNFNEVSTKLNSITDSISMIEFGRMVSSLEQTIDNFNAISSKIESGEGSLGKLIQEDSVYANLENSTKQLEALLEDLRMNPKRYVHFSIFGKKNKVYQEPEEAEAEDEK